MTWRRRPSLLITCYFFSVIIHKILWFLEYDYAINFTATRNAYNLGRNRFFILVFIMIHVLWPSIQVIFNQRR